MAELTGSGKQGRPRVPQQPDSRTRRALNRQAGDGAFGGGGATAFTTRTTFAGKPTPGSEGNLAYFTDVNIFARDNGTGFDYFGPSFSGITLPVAAAYTQLNFTGSAAIDFSTGVAVLSNFGRGDGTNKLNAMVQPLPIAAPYGVFIQQSANLPADGGTTNALAGIAGWNHTTGKAFSWGSTWRGDLGNAIEVYYWSDVNTVAAEPYKFEGPPIGGFPWFGFEDDGVNRKYLLGNPDGNRFAVMFTEANNANGLVVDRIGFGINACGPTQFQVSQTLYSIAYAVVPHG